MNTFEYEKSVNETAKDEIYEVVINALGRAVGAGELDCEPIPGFSVEVPSKKEHGDFATNVAMVSAKAFRKSPKAIAEIILNNLCLAGTYLDRAEIKGPGFINFFLAPCYYRDAVYSAFSENEDYGKSTYGNKEKVNIALKLSDSRGLENVRGGAIADCLGAVMYAAGYDVCKTAIIPESTNIEALKSNFEGYGIEFDQWNFESDLQNSEYDKVVSIVCPNNQNDSGSVAVGTVRLVKNGLTVTTSDRTGEKITPSNFLNEIKKDTARFLFNMREPNSQLDFDLNIASSQSSQNPVYYVQYANARICSILKNLAACGIKIDGNSKTDITVLTAAEERALIKHIAEYPEIIISSAKTYDTSKIIKYAVETATLFHEFYDGCKVKCEDETLMGARIALCKAVRIVLTNVLTLFKISVPEVM